MNQIEEALGSNDDAVAPEASKKRSALALDIAQIVVGFTLTVVMAYLMRFGESIFDDFNLYYFAGLQERATSYTDNGSLFALMASTGHKIPLAGAFGTPSLIALVYLPLTYLSLSAAQLVWTIVSSALVVVGVRKAVDKDFWIGWLVLVVMSPAMQVAVQLGNMSVVTFALIAYSYGALRKKQGAAAGITLGLAIAFKLYPAFLLLPLIVKREVKVLAWAAGTLGVTALATVPILSLHDTWPAIQATSHLFGWVYSGVDNQSLPGFALERGASHSTSSIINYAGLALASACVIWQRKASTSVLFAASVVLMLMAQSISWFHYFPLMVIGCLAVTQSNAPKLVKVVAVIACLMAMRYIRYITLLFGHFYSVFMATPTSIVTGSLLLLAAILVSNQIRNQSRQKADAAN